MTAELSQQVLHEEPITSQKNPSLKEHKKSFESTAFTAITLWALFIWLNLTNQPSEYEKVHAQVNLSSQTVEIQTGTQPKVSFSIQEILELISTYGNDPTAQFAQQTSQLRDNPLFVATATPVATTGASQAISPLKTPVYPSFSTHTTIPTPTTTPETLPFSETEPFRIAGIEFDSPNPITFTLNTPNLEYTTIIRTIIYRDDFTQEELQHFLEVEFSPGRDKVAIDDVEGGVQVFAHSGWYQRSKRLAAEELRHWLEGGVRGPTDNRLSLGETLQRLQSLEGRVVTMVQNGEIAEFTVVTATFIPEEQVELFEHDTYSTLRSLQKLTTTITETGEPISPFDIYIDNLTSNPSSSDERLIFYTFCGWARESKPNWGFATRYVLTLAPVEQKKSMTRSGTEK